jgi:PAS domain S-box-containing protein
MRTLLRLRRFQIQVAISGAGLLVFWWLGDIIAATIDQSVVARGILLILIAGVTGAACARVLHVQTLEQASKRQIVELIPGLAVALDDNGRLTEMNTKLRDYLGVPADRDAPDWLQILHPQDIGVADAIASQVEKGRSRFSLAARLRGSDGEYRWFLLSLEPGKNMGGSYDGWYAELIDAQDEKLIEVQLRAGEFRFRSILDNLPGLISSADASGNLDYSNGWDEDYYGLDWPEVRGRGWLERIHPEERDSVTAAWEHSVQTGEPMDVIHRLQRYDGTYRWFRARVRPSRDQDGEVERWYGLITDIDNEKRSEEALQIKEYELHRLIDTLPTLIWSSSLDGAAVFLNRRWLDYTGLALDEAAGWGWAVAIHPDDRDMVVGFWRDLLANGKSGEIEGRMRRSDGQYRWFLFRGEPMLDEAGKIIQWLGSNTDIDDIKKTEQELRLAEANLRASLDAMPALMVSTLADGTVEYINAKWAEEGFAEADVYGGAPQIYHPDDLPGWMAVRERSVPGIYGSDVRLRRADGEHVWYYMNTVPIMDENGQMIRRYFAATKIHDRKLAEEALKAREHELQQILDTVPVMVFVLDGDGVPLYVNARNLAYYGIPVDELPVVDGSKVKGSIKVRVHPDDAAAVTAGFMHSFNTGESFAMRYRNFRAEGTLRWVEGRMEPLRGDDGKIVRWYGVITDIHDEIVAQERFRLATEKLSRAGQLAGLAELSASIAHEINQALAAVISNSNACQRWLAVEPLDVARIKLIADRIVRDANVAAEIVRRIRALFKQDAKARSRLNVNDLVKEVGQLLAREIAANRVEFRTELDPSLPEISADRVQVQQVLVNLFRNGIDALRTNTEHPKILNVRSFRDKENIQVEIYDSGGGIEDPERIFEPFFTTKAEGMGMGLAICRSILAAHGGALSARRAEERGSVFAFTLPIELENS